MSLERTNLIVQIGTAVIVAACAVVTVYMASRTSQGTPPAPTVMETPSPAPSPKTAPPAPAKKKQPLETSAINPKPQQTWLERFFNYIADENRKSKAKCVPYATDNPFYCDR